MKKKKKYPNSSNSDILNILEQEKIKSAPSSRNLAEASLRSPDDQRCILLCSRFNIQR